MLVVVRSVFPASCFAPQLIGEVKHKLPNTLKINPQKTHFIRNGNTSCKSLWVENVIKRYKRRERIVWHELHRRSPSLTCFFGKLHEGLDSFLSVAAFRGHGGDVRPPQGSDDVHHGLGLEGVRRNHPREEVVAPVVAQLRGCRRVADLRDLEVKVVGAERGERREERSRHSCAGAILVQRHRWLP